MRLTEIASELWAYEQEVKVVAGFWFPVRTVVARLPGNKLALYSPLGIDDALAEELAALGEVTWLIAPNAMHHVFVKKCAARYPNAEIWLAPSLAKKRPDIKATGLLSDKTPDAWVGHLTPQEIKGAPKLTEVVFHHPPSKSLIVCDLVFHVHKAPGALTSTILKMVGAWQKVGQSSMVRMVFKDKKAGAAAVRTVLSWDFERVIMAHGDIIEGPDAKAQLETAVSKMLSWG